MTVNRDTARRYTARARAAAVVLLAAGGAVIALPLPALRPGASAAAIPEPGPNAGDPQGGAPKREPPLDLELAISRIWGLGPPPAEVVAEAPKDPPKGPAQATAKPAEPAATPAGWRYIGTIMGPRGMHALMEREGRQKLTKVGDTLEGGGRVVAVEAEHITIDEGSGPKHIKIADRAARWTSGGVASISPPRPPNVASRPYVPGAGAPLTPAQAAKLANQPAQTFPNTAEWTDDERAKYDAEKLEKYRQVAEERGEAPEDGGSR